MEVKPNFKEFKRHLSQGYNLVPVYTEVMGDLDTPISTFLKLKHGDYSFLFESVEGGEKWGRYSFLSNSPSVVFKSKGRFVEILDADGKTISAKEVDDPLEELKTLMGRYKSPEIPDLPRFYGGAVGFLAYDMVRYFEELPSIARDDLNLPDMMFMLTDSMIIFDNIRNRIKIVVCAHLNEGNLKLHTMFKKNEMIGATKHIIQGSIDSPQGQAKAAYEAAVRKVEALADNLTNARPKRRPKATTRALKEITFKSGTRASKYKKDVSRAKEYIRSGDIIQVVLSQRLSAKTKVEPMELYRAIRDINPSPYMFYLKMKDMILVGSSPEVMVRVEGGEAIVRPIAGTRPRGSTEDEDKELEKELLRDPKEMAEHIMLVDLGRNDLGRIAKTGTVKVDSLCVIERYSHVMHIVSNVTSKMKKDKDAFDVVRATFPAGTLSGAPKIRAMEIIDELEPVRRGPYGGSVGYFSFNGNMDLCITIRTALLNKGKIYIQTGAGIVADSDPEKEHIECMNKARAMMNALNRALKGL